MISSRLSHCVFSGNSNLSVDIFVAGAPSPATTTTPDCNNDATLACQNEGSCEEVSGSNPAAFSCFCSGGYSGPTCTVAPTDCRSSDALYACANGGTCEENETTGAFGCLCECGWMGATCSAVDASKWLRIFRCVIIKHLDSYSPLDLSLNLCLNPM